MTLQLRDFGYFPLSTCMGLLDETHTSSNGPIDVSDSDLISKSEDISTKDLLNILPLNNFLGPDEFLRILENRNLNCYLIYPTDNEFNVYKTDIITWVPSTEIDYRMMAHDFVKTVVCKNFGLLLPDEVIYKSLSFIIANKELLHEPLIKINTLDQELKTLENEDPIGRARRKTIENSINFWRKNINELSDYYTKNSSYKSNYILEGGKILSSINRNVNLRNLKCDNSTSEEEVLKSTIAYKAILEKVKPFKNFTEEMCKFSPLDDNIIKSSAYKHDNFKQCIYKFNKEKEEFDKVNKPATKDITQLDPKYVSVKFNLKKRKDIDKDAKKDVDDSQNSEYVDPSLNPSIIPEPLDDLLHDLDPNCSKAIYAQIKKINPKKILDELDENSSAVKSIKQRGKLTDVFPILPITYSTSPKLPRPSSEYLVLPEYLTLPENTMPISDTNLSESNKSSSYQYPCISVPSLRKKLRGRSHNTISKIFTEKSNEQIREDELALEGILNGKVKPLFKSSFSLAKDETLTLIEKNSDSDKKDNKSQSEKYTPVKEKKRRPGHSHAKKTMVSKMKTLKENIKEAKGKITNRGRDLLLDMETNKNAARDKLDKIKEKLLPSSSRAKSRYKLSKSTKSSLSSEIIESARLLILEKNKEASVNANKTNKIPLDESKRETNDKHSKVNIQKLDLNNEITEIGKHNQSTTELKVQMVTGSSANESKTTPLTGPQVLLSSTKLSAVNLISKSTSNQPSEIRQDECESEDSDNCHIDCISQNKCEYYSDWNDQCEEENSTIEYTNDNYRQQQYENLEDKCCENYINYESDNDEFSDDTSCKRCVYLEQRLGLYLEQNLKFSKENDDLFFDIEQTQIENSKFEKEISLLNNRLEILNGENIKLIEDSSHKKNESEQSCENEDINEDINEQISKDNIKEEESKKNREDSNDEEISDEENIKLLKSKKKRRKERDLEKNKSEEESSKNDRTKKKPRRSMSDWFKSFNLTEAVRYVKNSFISMVTSTVNFMESVFLFVLTIFCYPFRLLKKNK